MKKTKSEVHYRHGSTTRRCGLCTMFRPGRPNSCTNVQGIINDLDLCDDFERKEKADAKR